MPMTRELLESFAANMGLTVVEPQSPSEWPDWAADLSNDREPVWFADTGDEKQDALIDAHVYEALKEYFRMPWISLWPPGGTSKPGVKLDPQSAEAQWHISVTPQGEDKACIDLDEANGRASLVEIFAETEHQLGSADEALALAEILEAAADRFRKLAPIIAAEIAAQDGT